MERLDEGFVEELESKIDETFKETEADEKEAKGPQVDTGSDHKDIRGPRSDQDPHVDLAAEDKAETVMFDLTEDEIFDGKKRQDTSTISQAEAQRISFRRYHPMEISTNTIVTKDNVEFPVRKFVKDLKECLRFSKAVSVRFKIKTVDEG